METKFWQSFKQWEFDVKVTMFKEVGLETDSDVKLKDIKCLEDIEIDGVYEFTERSRRGEEIIMDKKMVKVHNIEDRGEFLYVGFLGRSWNSGKFGYTRVYKDGFKEWGTIAIKRAYHK